MTDEKLIKVEDLPVPCVVRWKGRTTKFLVLNYDSTRQTIDIGLAYFVKELADSAEWSVDGKQWTSFKV